MDKESINPTTARRLLAVLELQVEAKESDINWALEIIHQISGYGAISLAKAAQDETLKKVLISIAKEEIAPTMPKELETWLKKAEERERAAKEAAAKGEKETQEFIETAKKAAETKAQIKVPPVAPEAPAPMPETPAPTQPVSEGFSIRVSPKFVEKLGQKAAFAPFTVAKFLSPRLLQENPTVATSLATSIPLSELSKKAEGLPEAEKVKILRFVEAINKARYSIVARMQLPMKLASIRGVHVTLMEASEMGLPQGQVAVIIQTAKVSAPSLLGGLGRQVLGGIAQRAISKGVTKLATKAITTALGTAVAPGVGTAVSLAVGWLVDKAKDLFSLVTRNAPKVAIGLGAFLFGTGFVLNSGLLMGTGGLVGFGGLVGQAGGVGPALSQAGGFASSVISGITSLAVTSIATPLIVALISIPVLVAIILFIINSGAYMVPPSASQFAESPYIDIEKTPNPPGPFKNPPPSVSVNYTIKIKAKKGTLTNIRFQYECRVVGSGGKTPCPSVQTPEAPKQISPTETFSFSYGANYDASFKDSIIVDTFTVTADAPDQKGATAVTSASVVIGNPPIDCPLPSYDTKGKRWASYTPGDENKGHGSNAYWQGKDACSYSLPQSIGCKGPTDSRASSNVCSDESSRCAQYGYAYDVWPSGGIQVFAPRVGKESVVWECGLAFANDEGRSGYTYACNSGPYHLVLTHLKEGARTGSIPSGQVVGELHPLYGNAHVHLEFSLNGVYQKPEDFFCF